MSSPYPCRPRRRLVLAIPSLALLLAACDPAVPDPHPERAPPEPSVPEPAAADPRPTVVFLGNSLTAGLGVDPQEAFPARVQVKIDDAGLAFRVINAGVSGETTAGGVGRIDWVLDQSPRVLVLALGANDALRGAPPETVRANLQEIIDRTRSRVPGATIVIAGMLAPPNLGPTYTREFQSVFPALATVNGLPLIPFLLEGVAADRSLNQADGIHPTAEGHEVIAATVWDVLAGVLAGVLADVAAPPVSSP